jgi:hypothetical protein
VQLNKDHPLWKDFEHCIEERGLSFLLTDLPWNQVIKDFWMCFLAGAQASLEYEAKHSVTQRE